MARLQRPARDVAQPDPNPWHTLLVVCSGMFMLLLDSTIVNIAQREIRASLDASLSELQWIVDAYLLVFVVLLLACGRIGDIVGRRRMFVVGIAVFTAASAACAAAALVGELLGVRPAVVLIAARALQGVGGAALMPQTLALIAVAFPAERRGAAFGAASAIASLAAIVGPLAGGALVTWASWEWVFLINLPVGGAVIVAARRVVRESRDAGAPRRLDPGGMLLSGGALLLVVFALIEGARIGWRTPLVGGALAGGVLLLAVFLWWEQRARAPMLRAELFRRRNFAVGNAAMAIFNAGVFGAALPLTIWFQGPGGYSPATAGALFAPMAVMMAVSAPLGGRLSDRLGARLPMAGGFALTALGLALVVTLATSGAGARWLLPAMAIYGWGIGLAIAQANAVPMRDAPGELAGAASGILNTLRMTGAVLGVSGTTSLLQWLAREAAAAPLARAGLSEASEARALRHVTEGRFAELATLGSPEEQARLALARPELADAFADATRLTLYLAALLLAAGAGIALLVRDRVGAERPAPAPVARYEEAAGD